MTMSYHRRCAGSPGVQAGGVAVWSWLECMLLGSLPRWPRTLPHTATRRNISMSFVLNCACGISMHVGSPWRWHPDKNPANREEAAERFKLVSDSKMCRVQKCRSPQVRMLFLDQESRFMSLCSKMPFQMRREFLSSRILCKHRCVTEETQASRFLKRSLYASSSGKPISFSENCRLAVC